MADGGEAHALRYSAFISYSHVDAAFARRLHRKLETYRLPRRLERRAGAAEKPARRLRPIFRDRDELTAAADLTDAVQQAVAESSTLIVVCSRAAAASAWVGREVTLFRHVHGDGAILAALIDGDIDDALPPTLRSTNASGRLLQPLAADFRKHGDGSRLALLKLVAVLAGVRLDQLVQRDAQRRIRRVTQAASAALLGMAAMAVLAVLALNARAAAERERARGESLIGFMLTDLRGRLKGVGRLDLLDAVNRGAIGYFRGQDLSQMSVSALEQRAQLLQAVGEDDEKRGKFDDAAAQFNEARRTTRALLDASPNDPARVFAHAQSEYWVGEVNWRTGDHTVAEQAFRAYIGLAKQLIAFDPGNPDWLMEVAYSNSNLGTFLLLHSLDLAGAKSCFMIARANFLAAAHLKPRDYGIKGDIGNNDGWLADIDRLSGKYDQALTYRRAQHEVLEELRLHDPRDIEVQGDEVANTLSMARILIDQGSTQNALSLIDEGLQKATELSKADSENLDSLREVRIYELFRARVILSSSPTAKQLAELEPVLGNCDNDRKLPNNDELVSFCVILDARRLMLLGESNKARTLLRSLNMKFPPEGDALTARWGLDFARETHAVLLTTTGSVQP